MQSVRSLEPREGFVVASHQTVPLRTWAARIFILSDDFNFGVAMGLHIAGGGVFTALSAPLTESMSKRPLISNTLNAAGVVLRITKDPPLSSVRFSVVRNTEIPVESMKVTLARSITMWITPPEIKVARRLRRSGAEA